MEETPHTDTPDLVAKVGWDPFDDICVNEENAKTFKGWVKTHYVISAVCGSKSPTFEEISFLVYSFASFQGCTL